MAIRTLMRCVLLCSTLWTGALAQTAPTLPEPTPAENGVAARSIAGEGEDCRSVGPLARSEHAQQLAATLHAHNIRAVTRQAWASATKGHQVFGDN